MKTGPAIIGCCVGWLLLTIVPRLQATETVTLYVTNAQGTVVAEMTPQGQVTYTAAYRPYGQQVTGIPQAGPGYTGHVNDLDTGLVYMQQRYYDPESQQFQSVDPVGPAPGNVFNFGRYLYANNNPLRYTDPNGRCPKWGDAEAMCKQAERQQQENERVRDQGGSVITFVPSEVDPADRTSALYAEAAHFNIDTTGVTLLYESEFGGLAQTFANGISIYGPTAFDQSFGMLGSTLLHEIVGHFRLQVQKGFVSTRTQALYMREVQAYDIQLKPSNIKRFNLASPEVKLLRQLRSRYYNALNPWRRELVDQGIYRTVEDY